MQGIPSRNEVNSRDQAIDDIDFDNFLDSYLQQLQSDNARVQLGSDGGLLGVAAPPVSSMLPPQVTPNFLSSSSNPFGLSNAQFNPNLLQNPNQFNPSLLNHGLFTQQPIFTSFPPVGPGGLSSLANAANGFGGFGAATNSIAPKQIETGTNAVLSHAMAPAPQSTALAASAPLNLSMNPRFNPVSAPSALNAKPAAGRGTAPKPATGRKQTAAQFGLDDSDDGLSSDGSASSDDMKSKKKREASSSRADVSVAEKRHLALQEKNRRAQRRFRERQKTKIQDLHKQIDELTHKVSNLQNENAALHSRTSILEKVLEMRNEQIQVMQENKEDVPIASGQASEAVCTITMADGQVTQLTSETLKKMTPEEMASLYQKCIMQLQQKLQEAKQTGSKEVESQVENMVQEVFVLWIRWLIARPLEMRKFVAMSREHITSDEDAFNTWKNLVKAMNLTPKQQSEVVQLKHFFVQRLEVVMEDRKKLNVQIQAHFPHATFHTKVALGYVKAHEAVMKLKENLRSEHNLVLDFGSNLFRKILTTMQAAELLVQAYPVVPDALAVASAVMANSNESAGEAPPTST